MCLGGEGDDTPCGDNICEECESGCDTVIADADTGGDAGAFEGE